MGEIADMMLEGVLCQGCGEYIGEGEGYPGFCAACAGDEDLPSEEEVQETIDAVFGPVKRVSCPTCGKRVRGEHGQHRV